MRPVNRRGTPVDPVPFLVVAAAGFLGCYSCGPIYLMEFGVGLPSALAVTTLVFFATTVLAYYRFVWTARPDLRSEIPAGLRLRRIVLAGLAIGGLFVLLSLPLY
ncbi:hypothetical protein [Halorussus ruber]|uniref:hypothetical protein n=1 Tax=Halorussus ruber TaxID=1126238 RepID=UPI001092B781|nr:hypothetical protein [Halorussus ruber]